MKQNDVVNSELLRLLNGLKSRDEATMREFYDEYSPPLYGLLIRIIPNVKKAEDVLLKVFKKACLEIDSYNNKKEPFFIWLYVIAIREAIEALKSFPYHDFKRKTRTNNTTSPITQTVQLEAIEQAVISLSYYKHLTCPQISELLQLPLLLVTKKLKSGYCKLLPSN